MKNCLFKTIGVVLISCMLASSFLGCGALFASEKSSNGLEYASQDQEEIDLLTKRGCVEIDSVICGMESDVDTITLYETLVVDFYWGDACGRIDLWPGFDIIINTPDFEVSMNCDSHYAVCENGFEIEDYVIDGLPPYDFRELPFAFQFELTPKEGITSFTGVVSIVIIFEADDDPAYARYGVAAPLLYDSTGDTIRFYTEDNYPEELDEYYSDYVSYIRGPIGD